MNEQVGFDITVVIPACNASSTIERAVSSCLRQDGLRETIVVLDGPDEVTKQKLRSYPSVNVISRPVNRGAPAARNLGLDNVQSKYVLFLDADDYLATSAIKNVLAAASLVDADLCIGSYSLEFRLAASEFRDVNVLFPQFERLPVLDAWLRGNYVPPCAIIWKTNCIRQLGGWNKSLAKNQDGELMFRALLSNVTLAKCNELVGVYVQSENHKRISRNPREEATWAEVRTLIELRNKLDPGQLEILRASLGYAFYQIARSAYSKGFGIPGAIAESSARELAFTQKPGSLAHKIASAVLGLWAKERLAFLVSKMMLSRRKVAYD